MEGDKEFLDSLPSFTNIIVAKEYCIKALKDYSLIQKLKLSEILSFVNLELVRTINSNPELKDKIKYNKWRKNVTLPEHIDIESIINAKK